jgi:winged helix domain-containing protein/ATPase family protein associated with various cellular activities (AAA)
MVSTSWEHLLDELQLLNACLLRDVRRRAQKNRQLDLLQGLVLNESEIIEILGNPPGSQGTADDDNDLEHEKALQQRINTRNEEQHPNTSLTHLSSLFQLERVEELCLLLCLAPEIDPRYARVFAFLQDDVTRKQPSVELVLRIFSGDIEESLVTRNIFSSSSALFRNRLVQFAQPSDKFLPLPQRTLKLDDRIAAFLLHTPQIDECLSNWVEIVLPSSPAPATTLPDEIIKRTLALVESSFSGNGPFPRPLIHVYGKQGSGRRLLATIASKHVGLPLLVADVRKMPNGETSDLDPLWRLCREALLLPAVILVENFDDLLQDGKHRELSSLLDAAHYFSPATFLSGSERWRSQTPKQFYLSLECPLPDATSRIGFWRQHLHESKEFQEADLIELSSKFSFTAGQINQTVRTAEHNAYWERRSVKELTPILVNEAARGIATPRLGGLARKIETPFTWSDIVLPEGQMAQLREIATHAKRSQTVFEGWGFGRTFSYGRGIAALFEGQSGTGKTMAASIIGRALGLDVYQIDLSCVVSKYIGETEKNLSLIFSEAQDSNAVLFFDEADALFGKRSEVKDAHDRYANIETAYLLQRMEEYSGIVILATNMKQNLDEAFVRRMRFIIHFPFPTDDDRERIWHKVFPGNAPLGDDVNFRWLSRKLKIAGGNIKNISLRAAFLAVEQDGRISMECVVEAAKRESEKIGKIDGLADFHFKEPGKHTAGIAEVA